MALSDKQRADLNANLPREHISQRKAGEGQKMLSYLEGWFVIDELNRIFGNGGWSYRSTVERVHEGRSDNLEHYVCTYLGRCVLTVGDCVIEDVGAGQGKAKDPGQAIEKAAKEAATDALKRCAKSLGRRLGLALYDKEQSHVADEPEPEAPLNVSNEAAILIAMLTDNPTAARKQIRDGWGTMTATDRAAINAAIERQKASK